MNIIVSYTVLMMIHQLTHKIFFLTKSTLACSYFYSPVALSVIPNPEGCCPRC